jgi:hypothetical protein
MQRGQRLKAVGLEGDLWNSYSANPIRLSRNAGPVLLRLPLPKEREFTCQILEKAAEKIQHAYLLNSCFGPFTPNIIALLFY